MGFQISPFQSGEALQKGRSSLLQCTIVGPDCRWRSQLGSYHYGMEGKCARAMLSAHQGLRRGSACSDASRALREELRISSSLNCFWNTLPRVYGNKMFDRLNLALTGHPEQHQLLQFHASAGQRCDRRGPRAATFRIPSTPCPREATFWWWLGGLCVLFNTRSGLTCTQIKRHRPAKWPSSQPGSWRSGWYGGWQRRRGISYASCPHCFRPASAVTTKDALGALVACVSRHRLAAFRHISLCLSARLFLVSPPVSRRLCRSLLSAGFLSALVAPSG